MVDHLENSRAETSLEEVVAPRPVAPGPPPLQTIGRPSLGPEKEPVESVDATITWEQYRKYCCHPSLGATSSLATTQLACSALNGINVQWEGVVRQVNCASHLFCNSSVHLF